MLQLETEKKTDCLQQITQLNGWQTAAFNYIFYHPCVHFSGRSCSRLRWLCEPGICICYLPQVIIDISRLLLSFTVHCTGKNNRPNYMEFFSAKHVCDDGGLSVYLSLLLQQRLSNEQIYIYIDMQWMGWLVLLLSFSWKTTTWPHYQRGCVIMGRKLRVLYSPSRASIIQ